MSAKLAPVSKNRPCPVCGGTHKCSRSPDGLLLCGRRDGPVPGFRHLGPAKDPTWHLYRADDDQSPPPPPPPPSPAEVAARTAGRAQAVAEFAAQLTPDRRDQLAAALKLPPAALDLLPDLGWNAVQRCWTFPELDADRRPVGLSLRWPDGTKRLSPGGNRGLCLPSNFHDAGGPVFVVEGMSDAVALAHCGLAAVGRPSARGGVGLLVPLLAGLPDDRPVIVLGENDEKFDGTWPGRDGAEAVAAELRKQLKGRTILVGMPPENYKDAREWVADRLTTKSDPLAVGADIAGAVGRAAKQAAANPAAMKPARRFKMPVPISALAGAAKAAGPAWVWDGYLARGNITLFSALPKIGKTTLLSHLFRAMAAGGAFCGRSLLPGKVCVVSEEADTTWDERRAALGLGDHLRILTRPFFGKPPEADWLGFLQELDDHLKADPADLLVFDTLANLWPVRDENSATDVQAAMLPLHRMTDGRAVLCVHHLRKSDGADGTGSRGSGALVGFVDLVVEMRKLTAASDPGSGKRELKAVGRKAGIPPEWVVALDAKANEYRFAGSGKDEAEKAAREARKEELRAEVWECLPKGPPGVKAEEVLGRLPEDVRPGEKLLRDFLRDGAKEGTWVEVVGRGKGGPFVYHRGEP